jgi:2-polyprenyl-3-methyl-5-hydroxy-6-metoxy-1,4-benzoquinol methylase
MMNKNTNSPYIQAEAKWDADYTTGTWDYLSDQLEAGRYKAVSQMLSKYAPHGSILELGCGEGILQSRMAPSSYETYIGIDISKVAIQKAAHLGNHNTQYVYADMETFVPEAKFDAIIVNEALYYAVNPVQLLKRYANFLQPNGCIIISIFETTENRQLLNKIDLIYSRIEHQVTTNERGSWYCQGYLRSAIIG